MLHKFSKINGSERTLEKTIPHLLCLQGIIIGNYLDSLLSDPLLWNVLFHYLMNLFLRMLVQWTSKLCPFHISNIILGYRYTLRATSFTSALDLNALASINNLYFPSLTEHWIYRANLRGKSSTTGETIPVI